MLRPAPIGDPLDAIDTPALIIDLDAFEKNLNTMSDFARAAGVRLRPHAKTHKCVEVAKRQIARGAVGQCVQKVGEAEALVAGGITDVLVSNQIVGDSKLDRLMQLAKRATIGLCFDDVRQVMAASAAAQRAGVTIDAYIEIETGMQRCGLEPGVAASSLAHFIAHKSAGLRFKGVQAYQGKAQHFRTPDERKAAIDKALEAIARTRKALADTGLDCEIITGAGTGTFRFEAASGDYNELQCGSYAFMDADYAANQQRIGEPIAFEHSLFVLTTIMSTAGARLDLEDLRFGASDDTAGYVVADAGLKSYTGESGLPLVHGRPELLVTSLSDEHARIDFGPRVTRPVLGEKLLLIPGHCDPTINLHDEYVCIRNGKVEAIWKIEARGKSR